MKTLPFLLLASLFLMTSCSEPSGDSGQAEAPGSQETTSAPPEPTEPEAPVEPEAAPAGEPAPGAAPVAAANTMKPRVVVETSAGNIILELDKEKAPGTVENFLGYVQDGFYDNTVFHRVIEGFMVQGGGFGLMEGEKIQQKETKSPIQNEAQNGLKNARGTIAMARTGDPHSATAQFFINHGDNSNLDYPSFDGWGYAVFGKVVEGIEVVDKIAASDTTTKVLTTKGGDAPMNDVPVETVVIQSVKIVQ